MVREWFRCPFALHMSREQYPPAQFCNSVVKRFGSGESCYMSVLNTLSSTGSYYKVAIDAGDEVEPRFQLQVLVRIPKYLKTV